MKSRHLTCIALASAGLLASSGAAAQSRSVINVPQPVRQMAAPGVPPGSPVVDAGVATPMVTGGGRSTIVIQPGDDTSAMGYGAVAPGPYSAVDIARAFLEADTNHDGQLTREEARHLAIPVPFDELDQDHDGVLSRSEYDDFFK